MLLRMSSNIPLFFGKCLYDNCYYIDGAFTDFFPIIYANSHYPDKILGIDTGNIVQNDEQINSIIQYIYKIFSIPVEINRMKTRQYKKKI